MASRAPSQQDGLHNIVTSPEFQAALYGAIEKTFAGFKIDRDLITRLTRFTAKGDHNQAASFSVGVQASKILERDENRVEAWVYNAGSVAVYVGGRQVTVGGPNDANGGIPIQPNSGIILSSSIGELWAIASSAAQDVRVLDVIGLI